jgi:hypothetical protein
MGGAIIWQWIVVLTVVAHLSLSDAVVCSFEGGTLCNWTSSNQSWVATQASSLSDAAIDQTLMKRNGYILSVSNQSLGDDALFSSPFAYYPSPSCSLTFYYHPPVNFLVSLLVSLVPQNGTAATVWNTTWSDTSNVTGCNSTWSWYPATIPISKFSYPFRIVFKAQFELSNTSMTEINMCNMLALDEVNVTGCDPVPPQISLTVYNTIVVKLGSSFNLSVAVTGIPVPSVQWFRKEHQLMSSDRLIISMGGQVVHIKDATLNDSGVFTVTAIARGISASRHIQVIVYDPPTIHDIPENLTTIEGRNLTINCSASGHPNVTFRWLYKGRLIQNGQVLHLSEIKSSDQGNYSCVVSNLFGQAIQWTFVYVQVPPRITTTSFGSQVMIPENGIVTLICNASGSPIPEIMWKISLRNSSITLPYNKLFGGYTILANGELQVQGVLNVSGSSLMCVASSPAGSDESASTLVLVQGVRGNIIVGHYQTQYI